MYILLNIYIHILSLSLSRYTHIYLFIYTLKIVYIYMFYSMKSTSHEPPAVPNPFVFTRPLALRIAIIAQLLGEFLVTQQLMFQQSAANGTGPPEICRSSLKQLDISGYVARKNTFYICRCCTDEDFSQRMMIINDHV